METQTLKSKLVNELLRITKRQRLPKIVREQFNNDYMNNKTQVVAFRTSQVEHLEIQLKAQKEGLSKADYIRKKLLTND